MKKRMVGGSMALAMLLWMGSSLPKGAVDAPAVGKPCPDFVLNEITHHTASRASLKDFEGRWLILDFWTLGCTSCVESFPKIDRLQKTFAGAIQFMMVGKSDRHIPDIRKVYERYREKYGLAIPAAYDSVLFDRWGINTVPSIIIVDPRGMVYAITDGRDMDEARLEALVANAKPQFFAHQGIPYDPARLLLFDGNGGTAADLAYGSLLARWRGGKQSVWQSIAEGLADSGTRFQVTGVTLDWLYNYAYFGQSDWSFQNPLYGTVVASPLREVADDTPFRFDFATVKNLYSYSANPAPAHASVEQVQRMLRSDLQGNFGFTAAVERRPMPCWKLTATAAARQKLKTRGKGKSVFSPADAIFMNEPVSRLLAVIARYHPGEPPFIDETGITGNIDLKLDAIMTSLDDIRKALRTHGLDLAPASRDMAVIVVKDASGSPAVTSAR